MKTKKKTTASEGITPCESVCSVSSKNRLYLWMFLLTYVLFALNIIVLSPALNSLGSDVITASSAWPSLVSVLMHLIHIVIIPAAAWSIIGFSYFHREKPSVSRRLVAMHFGSLFFCRFLDMVATLSINGSLYLNEDIIYPAWYLVLELIYNLALFLMLRVYISHHRTRPKKKPIKRLIFLFSLILFILVLGQEALYTAAILYDKTNPLTNDEITVMVGRYIDVLIIGFSFYWLSRLLYRILEKKAKQDEEHPPIP